MCDSPDLGHVTPFKALKRQYGSTKSREPVQLSTSAPPMAHKTAPTVKTPLIRAVRAWNQRRPLPAPQPYTCTPAPSPRQSTEESLLRARESRRTADAAKLRTPETPETPGAVSSGRVAEQKEALFTLQHAFSRGPEREGEGERAAVPSCQVLRSHQQT